MWNAKESFGGPQVRWARVRPDGGIVSSRSVSAGLFEGPDEVMGQFDGFRFGLGVNEILDVVNFGTNHFHFAVFEPPQELYQFQGYNSPPTVTANAQNPGQAISGQSRVRVDASCKRDQRRE